MIAVTGSAGVGKSTFLGRLLGVVRQGGKTAAVLACDPQSPLTGGALLGDVFRMAGGADDGLFLRCIATPGGRGGVAEHIPLMLRLLAGFGFDVLFVETVGSGQGDVKVRDVADIVVLLTQPFTGDELQWEKAGILEIADLVIVHKSDLPGAEQTAAQLRDVLRRSRCRFCSPAAPAAEASPKPGERSNCCMHAAKAAAIDRQLAKACGSGTRQSSDLRMSGDFRYVAAASRFLISDHQIIRRSPRRSEAAWFRDCPNPRRLASPRASTFHNLSKCAVSRESFASMGRDRSISSASRRWRMRSCIAGPMKTASFPVPAS